MIASIKVPLRGNISGGRFVAAPSSFSHMNGYSMSWIFNSNHWINSPSCLRGEGGSKKLYFPTDKIQDWSLHQGTFETRRTCWSLDLQDHLVPKLEKFQKSKPKLVDLCRQCALLFYLAVLWKLVENWGLFSFDFCRIMEWARLEKFTGNCFCAVADFEKRKKKELGSVNSKNIGL